MPYEVAGNAGAAINDNTGNFNGNDYVRMAGPSDCPALGGGTLWHWHWHTNIMHTFHLSRRSAGVRVELT